MSKLYNEEIKERYLSTFDNEGTKTTIKHVFYKSFLIEDTLGIDLCNFNLDQIGKAVSNSSPLNFQSSRTIGRIISGYVNWAIENGLKNGSNINPLKGIPQTYFDQFIDKTKKIHYSEEEFYNIVDNLRNAIDKCLLVLLWNNISGEKLIELSRIRLMDIHWSDRKIDIMNEQGELDRTVTLSERDMNYISEASQQTIYRTLKDSGEILEKELMPSNYLFRNVVSGRATEGEMLNFSVLYTRLKRIREEYDISYLTPNSIKQSRMLKEAVELYKRDGIFSTKQRDEIGKKFNMPTVVYPNGEEITHSSGIKFINAENIKELYDIDIEIS